MDVGKEVDQDKGDGEDEEDKDEEDKDKDKEEMEEMEGDCPTRSVLDRKDFKVVTSVV